MKNIAKNGEKICAYHISIFNECSEDGEDLYIENDKYSDAKNTDNEYSDQEENALMWNCISILSIYPSLYMKLMLNISF